LPAVDWIYWGLYALLRYSAKREVVQKCIDIVPAASVILKPFRLS
jgi:hypothetical protein